MIVNNFKALIKNNFTTFTAAFFSEGSSESFIVSVRLLSNQASSTIPYNAFFVLAVPIAIKLKENLIFEGTVSQKIYSNLVKANKKYFKFHKEKFNIKTNILIETKNNNQEYAQFFTLGLDSMYTLFKNQKLNPLRISYLIYIDGFDIRLSRKQLLKKTHTNILKVAKKLNKEVIFISCNIRDLSDKILEWSKYHGAAIAGCAHCTRDTINHIIINSADSYLFQEAKNTGTGKEIDKIWSSERKIFCTGGLGLDRLSKAQKLVNGDFSELVYSFLRVCWVNSEENINLLNCCKCEKCFRTYLVLIAAGAPIKMLAFNMLDLKNLSKVVLPYDNVAAMMTWKKAVKAIFKRQDLEELQPHLENIFDNEVKSF